MAASTSPRRVGVWLIGARGGLAVTAIAGAELLRRKLISDAGLITQTPPFAPLKLASFDALVFGGHDIRTTPLVDGADEIRRDSGALTSDAVEAVRPALAATEDNLRIGTALNCGPAVERLGRREARGRAPHLREQIARLREDISEFRARSGADSVIVVNLASTEPPLKPAPAHATLRAFDRALDENRREVVRAGSLYAYAALDLGSPFLNFTPSESCLVPALQELAVARGAPFMGNDGKTGETLVKSALAPMFRHRNLRVLSWQGYNILGDRDGLILSDARHKESKLRTKDSVLQAILGYPLHTHVGIDYVPSLGDMKTAWDFIHFRGFLDFRMALQFTWHGCDAVLAAPIVLDMVRLLDLAHRRGEAGPASQLACFFKSPLGVSEHDFHAQMRRLEQYVAGVRGARRRRTGR